ncbi:MAG: hypothetical protein MJB57_07090 [Gemmatimonadetes bacterium]|nr:hypothetical protein [Gemmatimonadota bacterium]
MRVVIFGVIGLVVGLGGGVGYSLTLGAPAEGSESGEAGTDSARVAIADTAETIAPGSPADSAAGAPDSTGVAAASDSAAASDPPLTRSQQIASSLIRSSSRDSAQDEGETSPGDEPPPAPPVDPDTAAATVGSEPPAGADPPDALARAVARAADMDPSELSTENEAGYRRVSRILAAMDAEVAAQVMAGLRDGEVSQLIGMLPPRTAAAILAELDPARVARLSRALFKPMRSSS